MITACCAMEIAFALQARKDMRVVGEAEDGQDGVEFFLKVRPNITLVDLQMPRMNGIDTIVAIRQHDPKAKIIVLATYSGDAQVVRALRLGIGISVEGKCCAKSSS
jgi:two-component system NarL family response regulator